MRGHVCFGVRDRRTGQWQRSHWALGQRLASAIADSHGAICSLGVPVIGEPLCFSLDGEAHYTSPLIAIEAREALDPYDRLHPVLRRRIASKPAGTSRETF